MRGFEAEIIEELEEFENIMKDTLTRIDRIAATFSTIHGQLKRIDENAVVIRNYASGMS